MVPNPAKTILKITPCQIIAAASNSISNNTKIYTFFHELIGVEPAAQDGPESSLVEVEPACKISHVIVIQSKSMPTRNSDYQHSFCFDVSWFFAISASPRPNVQGMVMREGENLLLELQEKNYEVIRYVGPQHELLEWQGKLALENNLNIRLTGMYREAWVLVGNFVLIFVVLNCHSK